MACYAIGDIQGCFETFGRLLQRVQFDPAQDRLWLVGDLVNRGPDSLGVLRWVQAHDAQTVAVLGNHDLHLLARAAGVSGPKRRDTLEDVLRAPDLPELVDWLRWRPLVHREDPFLLFHAGVLPQWTPGQVVRQARAVESVLRSPTWRRLLAAMQPGAQDPEMAPHVDFISVITRIRTCNRQGEALSAFSGPPEEAPNGYLPWFAHLGRKTAMQTCVFGHWAALDLYLQPGIMGLDSGCVWGKKLTAVRLDDGAVFQVDAERIPG